jgi:hypothetical protein
MILNISFNKNNIKDHVSNILYEIKEKNNKYEIM